MSVIEEEFSVVGILEDLNGTFTAMERYVPRFFNGIGSTYQDSKEGTKNKNYNPNKKQITEHLRRTLQHKFSNDFEFYDFCKQRLYKQINKLQLPSFKAIRAENYKAINDFNQNREFVLL